MAEALEAPSPELEAARTIGEHLEGTCGDVAIEALGLVPVPGSVEQICERGTGPRGRGIEPDRGLVGGPRLLDRDARPCSRAPMRGPCRRARCPARARWRADVAAASTNSAKSFNSHARRIKSDAGPSLGSGTIRSRSDRPSDPYRLSSSESYSLARSERWSGRLSAPTTIYPIWEASLVAGTSGSLGARSS